MEIGILRWEGNQPVAYFKNGTTLQFPGENISVLFREQPLLEENILLIPENKLIEIFVFIQRNDLRKLFAEGKGINNETFELK